MLIGEGLGAQPKNLVHFAAGLEFLHNFQLNPRRYEDRSQTAPSPADGVGIFGARHRAINAGTAC